jgi:ABC-type bacteriocin/lantibiotic exporter with double-glycine peptidase domain
MVLKYWGYDVTPEEIGERVPVYKDGTTGRDLAVFVETVNLQGFLLQPPFEDLLVHLERGRPLVVTLPRSGSSRHAMVLVGFDRPADVVWLNDPASGECKRQPLHDFRKEWEKGQRWTFLILPK